VITAGHARAILSLTDAAAQEKLAIKIVNEELSVRAAESAAAALSTTPTKPDKAKPKPGNRRDHFDAIASKLGDKLDTRVKIAVGKTHGTITIDFATVADLNRIAGEIGVSVDD
jgi:ParB family chromosome partitioning protein